MDKEQFYKEFFRYLECGSCADLEFCQKQLEPACKTGSAIYRKLKLEDLEKENEQLKQQLAEKEKQVEELKKEIRDELVDNNMAILELQQSQNQIAIAVLEKVQKYIVEDAKPTIGYPYLKNSVMILNFVCEQIKSLKGENK